LPLDAAFSAAKAAWLLHQDSSLFSRAEAGELCLGTVDSWLLWNLTGRGVHGSDVSNASRTLLFNIHAVDWDNELLELFSIPRPALPRVLPSAALHGEVVKLRGLRAGTPVHAIVGDSSAALFGQGCLHPGDAKATYGTGTSVMTPACESTSAEGLLVTIAWGRNTLTYGLEGNILSTGGTLQWLSDLLQLSDGIRDIARFAAKAKSSGGAYFVPAFGGLGSPYWDKQARGLVAGLTLSTNTAQLACAALESIAYQVRDVVDAVDRVVARPIKVLRADGGAAANDQLMQFQADILQRPVIRSASQEIGALGAAYMAGLKAGIWSTTDEIEMPPRPWAEFLPAMADATSERLYKGWLGAVAQARAHSSPTNNHKTA
jgi:glycerol kinase